jgi:predicted TIM-barrel fold metal-dependent hydrolase
MVVDAHSHLLQATRPHDRLPRSLDDLADVDVPALFAGMERLGIDRVVTLAQEMTRIRGQWHGSNALVADVQQRFPDRFVAVAGFEPVTRTDQFNGPRFEEVRALLQAGRVRGLLITPPYGHFQVNDRRAYPFYQLAVDHQVPVYVHQGAMYGSPERAPQYGARLWTLDQVVVDFPALRLNIEHMAWPWTEDLLAIMAHGPEVTTDVAMLARRPHLLAWHLTLARDYGFLDRIFWGTDYVGTDAGGYVERAEQELDFYRHRLNPILRGCGWPALSAEEIDNLLAGNVRRWLAL